MLFFFQKEQVREKQVVCDVTRCLFALQSNGLIVFRSLLLVSLTTAFVASFGLRIVIGTVFLPPAASVCHLFADAGKQSSGREETFSGFLL